MSEEIIIKESASEISLELARIMTDLSKKAIQERGLFVIGVSGGSMIAMVAAAIRAICDGGGDAAWHCWRVFLCDERLVPLNSADSTAGQYAALLSENGGEWPLRGEHLLYVDVSLTPAEAAVDYERQLRRLLKPNGGSSEQQVMPSVDLALLGLGPDGHTCSLFPGHRLTTDDRAAAAAAAMVAAVVDSPKPPPQRVTLTLAALNAARVCVFAATGGGKADVVYSVLRQRDPKLPASAVRPPNGRVVWLLDQPAGARLQE